MFKSGKFKQFCSDKFIDHVICPVRDHRGNGKVEGMIRTINERLRINKEVVISKEKTGLSKILFALRSEKRSDGKSAFERHLGRTPNTPKSRLIEKCVLEKDPAINIEPEDFSEEADSTILDRERVRGTKVEAPFKKGKGKVVEQTDHTITLKQSSSKMSTTYSKRDVANSTELTKKVKVPNEKKVAKSGSVPKTSEQPGKRKRPKQKRQAIEGEKEPEDLGQVAQSEIELATKNPKCI